MSERSEESKEIVIGFFNPLAAPYLRHDDEEQKAKEELSQMNVEVEDEEVEEEMGELDSGEPIPTSYDDLTDEERKEYFRYLQEEYEETCRQEDEEDEVIRREFEKLDQKDVIKEQKQQEKDLLVKITLDCMKKCAVFKTHPYLWKVDLFEKEEKCIRKCAKKSFQMLKLINKMNDDGEIDFSTMVFREHGMSDDL